ncbi:ABC transporter permease, partial [Pseudomonas syringae pv. tagetis]
MVQTNALAAKLPGYDKNYAYAVNQTAGMLAWSYFSEIIGLCLTLFIDQGNLMKMMRFPRITLPVIFAGSFLLNYV